jgi:hypothetical protein
MWAAVQTKTVVPLPLTSKLAEQKSPWLLLVFLMGGTAKRLASSLGI